MRLCWYFVAWFFALLWIAALGEKLRDRLFGKEGYRGDAVQAAPRLPMGQAIIAPDAFSLFELVEAMFECSSQQGARFCRHFDAALVGALGSEGPAPSRSILQISR